MNRESKSPVTVLLTGDEKRLLYRVLSRHTGRTMAPTFPVEDQRQLTAVLDQLERGIFRELSKKRGLKNEGFF